MRSCALDRCEKTVGDNQDFCSNHWHLVPEFHRVRVAAARRRGGTASVGYKRALKAALIAVETVMEGQRRRAAAMRVS